jgi:hypothetical protein
MVNIFLGYFEFFYLYKLLTIIISNNTQIRDFAHHILNIMYIRYLQQIRRFSFYLRGKYTKTVYFYGQKIIIADIDV